MSKKKIMYQKIAWGNAVHLHDSLSTMEGGKTFNFKLKSEHIKES